MKEKKQIELVQQEERREDLRNKMNNYVFHLQEKDTLEANKTSAALDRTTMVFIAILFIVACFIFALIVFSHPPIIMKIFLGGTSLSIIGFIMYMTFRSKRNMKKAIEHLDAMSEISLDMNERLPKVMEMLQKLQSIKQTSKHDYANIVLATDAGAETVIIGLEFLYDVIGIDPYDTEYYKPAKQIETSAKEKLQHMIKMNTLTQTEADFIQDLFSVCVIDGTRMLCEYFDMEDLVEFLKIETIEVNENL